MKCFAFIAAISLTAASAHAAETLPHYTIDPAHSTLGFSAKVNNSPSEGHFTTFSGDIVFAPQHLELSSAIITVDLASVSTVYPDVEESLVKPEWLDAKKYTSATFQSSAFHQEKSGYSADGTLDLHGKKLPVHLLFTMDDLAATSATATGNMDLKRLDFGIGTGEWADTSVVADKVTVKFHIVAKRTAQ